MSTLASRGQLRASFFRWALLTVPATMLLGFLMSRLVPSGSQNSWFMQLEMPSIMPAFWLFGLVWTILYLMMGVALALVCSAWGARGRGLAIVAFIVQFAVNLAWTPVFFGQQNIQGALIVIGVLDVLVIVTIALFWRVRRLAALLMLPYLAWALFATVLTYEFLRLNPEASSIKGDSGAIERVEL